MGEVSGRFLRLAEVASDTGLNARTIQRKIKAGLFPPSIPLVDASVSVWLESDIERWKRAQLGGVSWGAIELVRFDVVI